MKQHAKHGEEHREEHREEQREELRWENVGLRFVKAVERIASSVEKYVNFFTEPLIAKSMTVTIGDKNAMGNTVLAVGKTAQATPHLFSGPLGTGTEVKITQPVTWVSADPTVATVDSNGLITAIGPSKLDANNNPIPVDITGTTQSPDANGNLQTFSNPTGDATITDVPAPPPVAASMTVTVAPI
jgi:hypothetical protein